MTRRQMHFLHRMRRAVDAAHELWTACSWLLAEARRAQRLEDTIRAVLGLIRVMQTGSAFPTSLLIKGEQLRANIPPNPTGLVNDLQDAGDRGRA